VNTARFLDEAAAAWPDRTALVDDEGPMSFADLAASAHAIRDALAARGVGPGHGLGLVARNGRRFVAGLFGGLGTGAVVMPISHQLRRGELLGQLRDVALHAVIDDGSIEPLAGAGPLGASELRYADLGRDRAAPVAPHVPDAAFVRFTSGTTGRAKGVVVGHAAVAARTAAAREALGITPDDVVVWVLPMAWHFIVSVVLYVRYGATIVVSPDAFAASILELAAAHDATVLYASPMHVRMLASAEGDLRLAGLRLAISTSTALSPDVAEAFRARFGLPVRQVYGIIELGLPLGDLGDEVRSSSVGRPLPGYEAAVLDDEGRPLAAGLVGHLGLRGPGAFDAYLTPPLPRVAVLEGGWFLTGDLAVADETGRLTIAGRRKSMINVAGHKVFPEEVEAVLEADPTVARCRVFGQPHPVWGEVVHAEVVAAVGAQPDPDALRRACQERLSAHKVPQRVVLVADVPMTRTGKVARREPG
jgi:acyl-CoA synthetase (AMP-forming)/AMP-acid ligase II